MSRPRKPIENLTRNTGKAHSERGYNSTEIIKDVQEEIVSQYSKIKTMLSSMADIKTKEEAYKYQMLVNLLLKINNQIKTFSDKNVSDEKELKELERLLE